MSGSVLCTDCRRTAPDIAELARSCRSPGRCPARGRIVEDSLRIKSEDQKSEDEQSTGSRSRGGTCRAGAGTDAASICAAADNAGAAASAAEAKRRPEAPPPEGNGQRGAQAEDRDGPALPKHVTMFDDYPPDLYLPGEPAFDKAGDRDGPPVLMPVSLGSSPRTDS